MNVYRRYERWLMPVILVLSFISDVITFNFVSFNTSVIFLIIYLILAGLSIAVIQFYDKVWLAPLVLQYLFGSLFSAFVIFYSHSGSILVSWPFLSILVFLMVANEVFKKYGLRSDVQFIVYFFALFSFINLAAPYFFLDLGPKIFIISGVLSVGFFAVFLALLQKYSSRAQKAVVTIISGVIIVFVSMNIFYFTNLIPPIPLVARDLDIFYNVEKISFDEYQIVRENKKFWEKFLYPEKFYINSENNKLFAFSAVFAPARMQIILAHEWQYYDPNQGWLSRNVVLFPMIGGRKEGFRGFSITNLQPGRWRIILRTESGQVIARKTFDIVNRQQPLDLLLETR